MRSEAHEKACEEAAEFARQFVLKQCEKADLTLQKVLKGIVDALDADENKIFYDKDRGRCVSGPNQTAWGARAKAIDQAISILGIKAPEKLEHSGPNGAPIQFDDISPDEREFLLASNAMLRRNLNAKKARTSKK